jgi:hypothetical protein
MAVVTAAQSVPSSEDTTLDRDIWATVAYYYPQYTLKEARKLPARDIKLLIKIARKLEAEKMFNLTQIVAAPHTKKGEGVKKLSEHFKRLAK